MHVAEGELADPFVAAAVRVLTVELGSEVQRHNQSVEAEPLRGGEVTVMVGVTGSLKGLVALVMPLTTAAAVAGAMMGEAITELDDMAKSAVAELGNMMAGLATVQLEGYGYNSNITPPSIVTGKDAVISTHIGAKRIVVPLSTTFGGIAVHVMLTKASAA